MSIHGPADCNNNFEQQIVASACQTNNKVFSIEDGEKVKLAFTPTQQSLIKLESLFRIENDTLIDHQGKKYSKIDFKSPLHEELALVHFMKNWLLC